MKPPSSPPSVNIDLSQASDVICEKCGNYTFVEVTLMKRLSALVSPTGKAGNVPIPTFACNACGNINNEFLPNFMRKPDSNSSNISTTPGLGTPKLSLEK